MPRVGTGKKARYFKYTKKGKMMAKAYAKKKGLKIRYNHKKGMGY